jgi:hypothetical protein
MRKIALEVAVRTRRCGSNFVFPRPAAISPDPQLND